MTSPRRSRAAIVLTALSLGFLWVVGSGCKSGPSRTTWREASEIGTIESFQAYLSDFPEARFREQALSRIEALRWEEVQELGGYELVAAYCEDYPDSENRFEARYLLDSLEWERARSEGSESGVRRFLEVYPDNRFVGDAREWLNEFAAAREEARRVEEQERLEREAKGEFERVADSNSLEVWVDFARKYAGTSFRRHAGRKIELLAEQFDPELVESTRERMSPYYEAQDEDVEDEGFHWIFSAGVLVSDELEDPEAEAALLIKDGDYTYSAVSGDRRLTSKVAFEQAVLRRALPREVVVLQLKRSLFELPSGRLNQAITNAWSELIRYYRAEFDQSRYVTLVGPDEEVPDVQARGGRNDPRGDATTLHLALLYSLDELIEVAPTVGFNQRSWCLARFEKAGWTPETPRQAALLAILREDVDAARALGPLGQSVAIELVLEGHAQVQEIAERVFLELDSEQGPERLAWAKASAADSVALLTEYQAAFPQGARVEQAAARVRALLEDDAPFEALLAGEKGTTLLSFLRDYPGHRREADAKRFFEGVEISELQREQKIQIEVSGVDIQKVYLRVRAIVDEPVVVRIPTGMYFSPWNSKMQTMVTTAATTSFLKPFLWYKLYLPAACANLHLSIPGEQHRFEIGSHPLGEELVPVLASLEQAELEVTQAAVWILTDDATYEDLGILRRVTYPRRYGQRGVRLIGREEVLHALKAIESVGLDVESKRIWRDLPELTEGLEDPELLEWVGSRI